MTQTNPLVSVVIPSYNEATYIGRLLDCLAQQTYTPLEVIVSDAESKDGIEAVIDGHRSKLDITLVSSPPEGPGAGRNMGAKHAKGEWLLFLDADIDFDDIDFIKVLLSHTENNKWDTSSAKMTAHGKKYAQRYNKLYRYQKRLAKTKKPVASGYCLFTRASTFKRSGGFNENIHFGEDYEYVSRTGKNGKFGFVESTCYYVDPRRNEEEGLKLIYKGSLNEIYRRIFGYKKLEKKPIKYEFGKHDKRKSK